MMVFMVELQGTYQRLTDKNWFLLDNFRVLKLISRNKLFNSVLTFFHIVLNFRTTSEMYNKISLLNFSENSQ